MQIVSTDLKFNIMIPILKILILFINIIVVKHLQYRISRYLVYLRNYTKTSTRYEIVLRGPGSVARIRCLCSELANVAVYSSTSRNKA